MKRNHIKDYFGLDLVWSYIQCGMDLGALASW